LSEDGKTLRLRGLVALPDGTKVHAAEISGPVETAAALGKDLGEQLKAAGGPEFFAAITGH
jgi:hydroxymethylbilane synthase